MAIRVELCGRLIKAPVLRITPAGTPIVRLVVDCGATGAEFMMDIVMTGEAVREVAQRLKVGVTVEAVGSLRQVRSRAAGGLTQRQVEVLAEKISQAPEQR